MANDEYIIKPHLPRPYGYGMTPEQIRGQEESDKRAREAEQMRVEELEKAWKAKISRCASPDPPRDGMRYGRTWATLNE